VLPVHTLDGKTGRTTGIEGRSKAIVAATAPVPPPVPAVRLTLVKDRYDSMLWMRDLREEDVRVPWNFVAAPCHATLVL
jgi:hypothetical protein